MEIRAATHADAADIALLFNQFIRNGTETFNSVEKSAQDICDLIDEKKRSNHSVLVAYRGAQFLGFAYYAQFRGGVGYARTFEHTIYVDPAAAGHGVGRALMNAIEKHAAQAGGRTIYAGVSAENTPGIAFHKRLGYDHIWTLPKAGYKFGRYIDLVLMMKYLK